MYWENAEKDTDPIELYNPVVKRKLGIHNDDKQYMKFIIKSKFSKGNSRRLE